MTTEAILQILGIVFAAGIFYGKMESISKDIKRLEQAQKKYNDLQSRCYSLELWKEFHEKEHQEGKK
jgi:hypothetical protein